MIIKYKNIYKKNNKIDNNKEDIEIEKATN